VSDVHRGFFGKGVMFIHNLIICSRLTIEQGKHLIKLFGSTCFLGSEGYVGEVLRVLGKTL
ncbi:MAG: hypothetical protein VYC23_04820, partial [Chloroflexota bacterium]|nr:hypothetical protein [Chloroflexota bacterium]